MDDQWKVAAFLEEHGMESPPAYRLLDLASEVGEVAKDAVESTEYGDTPGELDVDSDEIGDVLFSVLALAEALDIEAGDALEEALAKYGDRIAGDGTPASGS